MTFEPGDIVLVPFPYGDLSGKKNRPALVVSTKAYNHETGRVIVCGMTSNLSNAAHSVLVDSGDMNRGRLPKTSRVKAERVALLEQELVRRVYGRTKPETVRRVMKELNAILAES